MQKKIENNYCLITGIVIASNKCANNVDIKRPVITVEILHTSYESKDEIFDKDVFFEEVPILLSEQMLAKAAVGISVGDVLNITGRICVDIHEGLYIEASTIQKMVPACKGTILKSIATGRSEMLQLTQIFNQCEIYGTVIQLKDKDMLVKVQRKPLSKGDLTNIDNISVVLPTISNTKMGDKVFIRGTIGLSIQDLSIFANDIYIINNRE